MRKWLVIVVSLCLVLALIWVLSRPDSKRDAAPRKAANNAPLAETQPAELAALDAPDKSAIRETAKVDQGTSADTSVATPATAATDQAEIRGRFLQPGGAAAGGVEVELIGASGSQERELRFGTPTDWKNIKVTSSDDGRFSIRFDPPRAYQFLMRTSHTNYCQVNWRWREIEPKKVVDVGDVTLLRGGSIRGRIVDSQGRALTKDWRVYAESGKRDFAGGTDQSRVTAKPDPISGEYLLLRVPPGSVRLSADSHIANWIEGPVVVVRENEETLADIPYSGPELSNRIYVSVSTAPFHLFTFGDFDVFLRGAGIDERKAKKASGSTQFAFEDVPPGRYRIEVRDPRFELWSKDDVEPGTSLSAKLKGSAALVLRVVDDLTNEPVSRYALEIRYERPNASPASYRILEERTEPPEGGHFSGIVAADATAVVRADGYSSCEVTLRELVAGEHRPVTARLVRAAMLTGRVVSGPERTPVEHAKVEFYPFRPKDMNGLNLTANMDPDAKNTESDASGRFSFDNLSAGEFTVRASVNKLFSVEQTITIAKSTTPPELELLLPARAWLVGKLIAPPGALLTGTKVLAAPVSTADAEDARSILVRGDDVSSPVAPDGSFRVGPIPAGEADVSAILPEIKIASGNYGHTAEGDTIVLGRVTLLANVETRRDFDLGAKCPGVFTFQVTVDAAPASDYSVYIENSVTHQVAGYVKLDAAGSGRSGPVIPGTYAFSLYRTSGSAMYPLDRRSELGPNQTVDVVLALQLFAGSFRVLDIQSGAPMAGQQIFLTPDVPDPRTFVSLKTDADGRATGRLALGRYRVVAGQNPLTPAGPETVIVDWSANDVSPAEVRLKRPTRN